MTNWTEIYQPLVGRTLDALIWMPMTSDTPDLVRDFELSAFSFTGGVFLAFDGKPLFLTWTQIGMSMVLGAGPDVAWSRYALNRVRVSPEEPWGDLEGAVLQRVELFTAPLINESIADKLVVGVRHQMRRDGVDHHFWIGTGGADFLGDQDDLWVGVGVEPSNIADLIRVGAIEA